MDRPRNSPHPSALIIYKRLPNFRVGVHHEGPIAHDGFIERLSIKDEEPRGFQRFDGDLVTLAL